MYRLSSQTVAKPKCLDKEMRSVNYLVRISQLRYPDYSYDILIKVIKVAIHRKC